MGKVSPIVWVVIAAAGGLFIWAYMKSKQPGQTGGVLGTIGALFGGAGHLVTGTASTAKNVGETAGSGIKDAVNGAGGLVKNGANGVVSIVKSVMPWNW